MSSNALSAPDKVGSKSLLLKNASFIHWKTLEISTENILVEVGEGGGIRFLDIIPENNSFHTIDCTGKFVTKSFAVGHHHAYSAMAKGMPAPAKNPQNFFEVLKYIWWNLDTCLDREMVEYSALVTAMACIKAGSTFIIDHHASPAYIRGSLELMAKAFEKAGMSHLLCYELTDRNGVDGAQEGLEETESYLAHHQGLVGLHASFTVNDQLLKSAVNLAGNHQTGVHIHVAEDAYDQKHCLDHYGKRVVERLSDSGALASPKSLLVHALHLSDQERAIIRQSPVWVVQNAESNMNNNVGFFNSTGLGENIMFGTDGMHSDMLQSARSAFLAGQHHDPMTYSGTYERFRKVHDYLQMNQFKGDGENNLVILNYDTGTDLTSSNFAGHFIFGFKSEHINSLISNGKLVMHERKILTIDEEIVLTESRKQARRLWDKMKA
jgi:cytosine/adenosine deaminase-related metal-dependent hydrolase